MNTKKAKKKVVAMMGGRVVALALLSFYKGNGSVMKELRRAMPFSFNKAVSRLYFSFVIITKRNNLIRCACTSFLSRAIKGLAYYSLGEAACFMEKDKNKEQIIIRYLFEAC